MRYNGYRAMWVMVLFDLPVKTKREKKAYVRFKKFLETDGFASMQYSVFIRHCGSRESAENHIKKVELAVPEKGHITIIQITDKQYGRIKNIWGPRAQKLPEAPKQLEFF